MQIKVISLDLDGTLTNSNKELTNKTKNALIHFQKNGGILVLASGRPTYGIKKLADELSIPQYKGYILAYNGAEIISCETKQIIYKENLNQNVIPFLYELSKMEKISILSYNNDKLITNNANDQYVRKEAEINNMGVVEVKNFCNSLPVSVLKVLMAGNPEILEKVEKCMKVFNDKFYVTRSEPFFLEFMANGISKDKGLKKLLNYLNLDNKSLAAFGDGYNDISMLEFAGFGVAMGNANAEVKAIADYITLSNDEDGIEYVIENMIF
jgi:Cof subfamily protein (haloacid dehalogenase superfamily)